MLDYLFTVKASHRLKASKHVVLRLDWPEQFSPLAEMHEYLEGIGR